MNSSYMLIGGFAAIALCTLTIPSILIAMFVMKGMRSTTETSDNTESSSKGFFDIGADKSPIQLIFMVGSIIITLGLIQRHGGSYANFVCLSYIGLIFVGAYMSGKPTLVAIILAAHLFSGFYLAYFNDTWLGQKTQSIGKHIVVNIENKASGEYVPKATKKSVAKAKIYPPGTYTIHLKAGETIDHWIMFPAGRKNHLHLSSNDDMFVIRYDNGKSYNSWENPKVPKRTRAKFKITAVTNQTIRLKVT